MFDFNTAETQRMREVIPADTVAPIQINFRPGDAGEGKWLKSSKDGTSRGLDCEFTVVAGEHAKRKFWSRLTVEGETDGQKTAADITRVTLRAILESARGIRPDDQSDDAKKARMAEYADFDGIRFIGRIGVEAAKNGYAAKNTLLEVITPERKNWRPVEQVKPRRAPRAAPSLGAGAGDLAARVGEVKSLRPKGVVDFWQRQATAAAIASARKMVGNGAVPPDTPVGHLSDEQLGWMLCAGICSWIYTRAAQAVDEGNAAVEMNIRDTGTAPAPWDAGAIETILPDLGAMSGIDWAVPIGGWSKSTMLLFLCTAYELMAQAIAARDRGGDLTAPQAPLNDSIPFG